MNEEDGKRYDADVLVLGAGMAGLATARALAAQGLRVLVLEARERIGGRIFTERVGDEVVELGAEFVHGRPPELLALIEEAGLELVERDGYFIRFQVDSLHVEEDGDSDAGDDPFSVLEELEDYEGADLSFAEYIEQKDMSDDARAAVIGFVEGFNAADNRVISVAALGVQQKAEDAIEGDRSFHVKGGYDQVPEFLATKIKEHGGEIRLNTRVQRIEWGKGCVVAIADEKKFCTTRVVITLPISLLQRGEIDFEPTLPANVRRVLKDDGPIRTGHALRFTLIFRERFWERLSPQPAMSELSFLFTQSMVPTVWWTPHPEVSNAITGWIGGPRSLALEGQSAEVLSERACDVLARALGMDLAEIQALLIGCYTHDWSADAASMGAYSYVAKDGMSGPDCLATPIDRTLYFAGEHTTTDGHWGTVHAALGSGLRAATQIAEEIETAAKNVAGLRSQTPYLTIWAD